LAHVRGILLIGRSGRLDLLLAAALTVAGELEVLLSSTEDGRLVRALALPLATVPLAWRRDLPLLPPAAVAVSLLLQVWLGDFFAAGPVVPLAAIVFAGYAAGRHARSGREFAAAALLMAVIASTRIAFDPDVDDAGVAVVTAIAVGLPFLIGRWMGTQARLQRELAEKSARRERERERDARDAAEEERMRIAADLEAAVADRLAGIVDGARELPGRLAAGDHAVARERLAAIAGAAREALADVRRVLGILRREGTAPLAPSSGAPAAAASAPAPPPDVPDAVPPPRPARVSARAIDRLLVAVLLVGGEVELALTTSGGERAFAAVSAVAVVAPLLWRRRHPVPIALAVLAAVAVQSTVLRPDAFPASDIGALMCASYAVGAYAPRRAAVVGLGLLVAGEAVHAAVFHPGAVAIAMLGGAAVPWTVGRIVRGQRLLMEETREKAAQIDRIRARDARAAVTAERMRVARELHDAVAHNLSVIAIQAGGADGIVERDPARASQCAELIETVAGEALAELGRLTGVPTTGRDGPPPSLARVEALAQRARDGGLPVELRIEGEPSRLAAGVDLAAFRIVQEALANVAKHAGAARAWVVVRYERRAVELEIGDDGRGSNGAGPAARLPADAGGHGLVGMRERAALYGGTLDAGSRPGGGFAVRARLPLGEP
jgi:signal transduction histidine kinase